MLLGDFFEISTLERLEDNVINADITINKDHEIFKGHFPGFPVVPGVCLVQIIIEIMTKSMDQSLLLYHGRNIKFLQFIDPNIHGNVKVKIKSEIIEKDQLKSEATIFNDEYIFLKLKGIFKKES